MSARSFCARGLRINSLANRPNRPNARPALATNADAGTIAHIADKVGYISNGSLRKLAVRARFARLPDAAASSAVPLPLAYARCRAPASSPPPPLASASAAPPARPFNSHAAARFARTVPHPRTRPPQPPHRPAPPPVCGRGVAAWLRGLQNSCQKTAKIYLAKDRLSMVKSHFARVFPAKERFPVSAPAPPLASVPGRPLCPRVGLARHVSPASCPCVCSRPSVAFGVRCSGCSRAGVAFWPQGWRCLLVSCPACGRSAWLSRRAAVAAGLPLSGPPSAPPASPARPPGLPFC